MLSQNASCNFNKNILKVFFSVGHLDNKDSFKVSKRQL